MCNDAGGSGDVQVEQPAEDDKGPAWPTLSRTTAGLGELEPEELSLLPSSGEAEADARSYAASRASRRWPSSRRSSGGDEVEKEEEDGARKAGGMGTADEGEDNEGPDELIVDDEGDMVREGPPEARAHALED